MRVLSGNITKGSWTVSRQVMTNLLLQQIPLSSVLEVEHLGAGTIRDPSSTAGGLNAGSAVGIFVGGLPGALVGGFVGGSVGNRKQVGVTCWIRFSGGKSAIAAVSVEEYQLLQAATHDHRRRRGNAERSSASPKSSSSPRHQLASTEFRTLKREKEILKFRVFEDQISWETLEASSRKLRSWSIPASEIRSAELGDSPSGSVIVIQAYDTEYVFALKLHTIEAVFSAVQEALSTSHSRQSNAVDRDLAPTEDEQDDPRSSASRTTDATEQIGGLHQLFMAGALSREEFDAAKAKLLEQL